MVRRILAVLLLTVLFTSVASAGLIPIPFRHHKKKQSNNPLADLNSKQPDKVLFDRAMDAMQHGKFDVARLSLQTLINTYPDSEYVARAKLGIGDAWYKEGSSTALAQAEIEYKDFITFFPNMPEAAEAQLKVANIHYRQMGKPDRDFTHARRAEEEYRQLMLQFPDSKLVPQAQERLREVEEVLAQREYEIGRFYYLREAYPAAIGRLKTLADTYPLFSNADDALFLLGSSYEHQMDAIRRSTKMSEAVKGRLIAEFTNKAAAAYSRIVTRYPVMDRADDAKARLKALNRPVPRATPQAIALNKKEEDSRGEMGRFGRMIGNFKHGPDVSHTAKVGEPTLSDPQPTSAVQVVRDADAVARGENTVALQTVKPQGGLENQPAPKSSDAPANNENGIDQLAPIAPDAAAAAAGDTASGTASPQTGATPASGDQNAPLPPPAQVNDADAPAGAQQADSSDPGGNSKNQDSTSKKKKKKGLRKLIPF